MITVYSLPECIQCELTMRAFRRRGIEPVEVKMTEAQVEEWRSKGALTAPIVDTGQLLWFGLKPDMIQRAANDAMGRPNSHTGA